jgi:hypothetical protein
MSIGVAAAAVALLAAGCGGNSSASVTTASATIATPSTTTTATVTMGTRPGGSAAVTIACGQIRASMTRLRAQIDSDVNRLTTATSTSQLQQRLRALQSDLAAQASRIAQLRASGAVRAELRRVRSDIARLRLGLTRVARLARGGKVVQAVQAAPRAALNDLARSSRRVAAICRG